MVCSWFMLVPAKPVLGAVHCERKFISHSKRVASPKPSNEVMVILAAEQRYLNQGNRG
jgi:hypothetical protein